MLRKLSAGSDLRKMLVALFACCMRAPRMEQLQSRTKIASVGCEPLSNRGTRLSMSASVPRASTNSRTTTGSKSCRGRTTTTRSLSRPAASTLAWAPLACNACVGESMDATPPAMATASLAAKRAPAGAAPYSAIALPHSISAGSAPCGGQYRGETCAGMVTRSAPSLNGSSKQYSSVTSACSPAPRRPMEAWNTSAARRSRSAARKPRPAASANADLAAPRSRTSPLMRRPSEKRALKPDTDTPSISGNTYAASPIAEEPSFTNV
mmetsp:Transcript_63161/g.193203  ORF Transcript_63161/g.193203 Transcript_63161/m.193203 type:complete len:266 (-) Transcript_63161:215-1012(-)